MYWWTSLCYQRSEATDVLKMLQYNLSFSLQIILFYLYLLFRIIHPEIRNTKPKDYYWGETAFILLLLCTNSCTHLNCLASPYTLSRERIGFLWEMILSTQLRFLLKITLRRDIHLSPWSLTGVLVPNMYTHCWHSLPFSSGSGMLEATLGRTWNTGILHNFER